MLDIHANKIIANKFIGEFENNNDGFNIGDIKWSATDLTQVGFLIANGASVRRDTYIDLYNAIGTRWGSVDEEHFNLPNLIGRFAEGNETVGGYNEAGLPSIELVNKSESKVQEGTVESKTAKVQIVSDGRGCIGVTTGYAKTSVVGLNVEKNYEAIGVDIVPSNPIYGKSSTVQPNSVLLIPYIKAFKGASASSTDLEITKVANDVANKANMNLSNLSEIGRKAFFPSDTYVVVREGSGTYSDTFTYVAPANGLVVNIGKGVDSNIVNNYVSVLVNEFGRNIARLPQNNTGYASSIVKKGDKIVFAYTNVTSIHARFYYAEGEV